MIVLRAGCTQSRFQNSHSFGGRTRRRREVLQGRQQQCGWCLSASIVMLVLQAEWKCSSGRHASYARLLSKITNVAIWRDCSNVAQIVLPRPANRLVSLVNAVRLVRKNGLLSRKICWKGLTEKSTSKRHAA